MDGRDTPRLGDYTIDEPHVRVGKPVSDAEHLPKGLMPGPTVLEITHVPPGADSRRNPGAPPE
jgi:hypothetical protein